MNKKIEFIKLFSDKTRIRILNLLYKRKVCVCEIKNILKITQAGISKHISKIKKFGILKEEQKSFWSYYSINISDKELKEIFDFILSKFSNEEVLKKDLEKISYIAYSLKERCN